MSGSSTTQPASQITSIPVGTQETLTWKGGDANNDPAKASNWSPNDAPKMSGNQTLVMTHGSMNLDAGNLAANQLNVNTGHDNTATVNLKAGGTLDANVPDGASSNLKVDMSRGGEAVTNIFTGPTSELDATIKIDASTLDLMANMSFGKLEVDGSNGGVAFLQGTSKFLGTNVVLNTKLSGSGEIDLASSGNHAARLELKTDSIPTGVTVNIGDHVTSPANGIVMDHLSTTVGGMINLSSAYAEVAAAATSYTMSPAGSFNLYNNGTLIGSLNVASTNSLEQIHVGVAGGNTYIYNCAASAIPLGGGSSGGTGGQSFLAASSPITDLPMHA
jgi:hypothetical protein